MDKRRLPLWKGQVQPSAYMFEVVHLQHLLASVSHSEDLDALAGVDLHHAVRLRAVQHRFVLVIVHLRRHGQSHPIVTNAATLYLSLATLSFGDRV